MLVKLYENFLGAICGIFFISDVPETELVYLILVSVQQLL